MNKHTVIIGVALFVLSGCGQNQSQPAPASQAETSSVSANTVSSRQESQSATKASVSATSSSTSERKVLVAESAVSVAESSSSLPKSVVSSLESTVSAPEKSLNTQDYRDLLVAARDAQQHYINSLPSAQRQSVQTPHAAMMVKYQELIIQYPAAQPTIDKVLQELTQLEQPSVTPAKTKSIPEIMSEYATVSGTNYVQATPAIQLNYYGFAVPDELLSMVHFNGAPIAFQFYGYTIGSGTPYELLDCYVNEYSNEIILFVQKDGQKMVLHSAQAPETQQFSIDISQNDILNAFVK